ncbi:hypothetical protein FRB94_005877 [Tulasnella sp. JGI-2019a]|nr:hypothetical protein FRB93_006364 [Tulasnella sp. JGI-2019a]KAG8999852.1 hypothetical protein FRB94_005877 [Tulasnella sp. JGI-2019a]
MDQMTSLELNSITIGICTTFILAVTALVAIRPVPFPSTAPPRTYGLPLIGPYGIITKDSWEVFKRGMAASKTGNFSFNLVNNRAIGLSSNSNMSRETFYTHPMLGFRAGYGWLFGAPPSRSSAEERPGEEHWNKRLKAFLKNEWLAKGLDSMIHDTSTRLDQFGSSGTTNPFYSMHSLVFQVTIRSFCCGEIAEDPDLREEFFASLEAIDECLTPVAVLFPSLPSPAKIRKLWNGFKIFRIIQSIANKREKTGWREDDALQAIVIVETIAGMVHAGLINTGANISSLLLHLGTHPEWMSKARAEVAHLAAKYAKDVQAPLAEQLLSVPLAAWESELPVLELCSRETLRLHAQGTTLRRNIASEDIKIGNEVIPSGALVFMHSTPIMMNPGVYMNPEIWDPSRYQPDRVEDKNGSHVFLGWGSGRHPCRGMRFAKLEQNIIVAMFLAKFKYDVLDTATGNKVDQPPESVPRDFHVYKPDKWSLGYKAWVGDGQKS